MNISWQFALIVVTAIGAIAWFLTRVSTGGMRMEVDKASAERAEDYRKLAEAFATLSTDLKAGQEAMSADIAEMRAKIDSVERMMREVG